MALAGFLLRDKHGVHCAAALEPIDEGNAAKRGALACETKHLSSEIELSSGRTVKGVIA